MLNWQKKNSTNVNRIPYKNLIKFKSYDKLNSWSSIVSQIFKTLSINQNFNHKKVYHLQDNRFPYTFTSNTMLNCMCTYILLRQPQIKYLYRKNTLELNKYSTKHHFTVFFFTQTIKFLLPEWMSVRILLAPKPKHTTTLKHTFNKTWNQCK